MPSTSREPVTTVVNNITEIITATVFVGPTDAPTTSSKSSVPIAAVAGGVLAGIFLAILVAIGWMCWGRAIRRAQLKQRRQAEELKRTTENTLQNARISRPRVHAYRPLFGRPAEQKVSFAGSVDKAPDKGIPRKPSPGRRTLEKKRKDPHRPISIPPIPISSLVVDGPSESTKEAAKAVDPGPIGADKLKENRIANLVPSKRLPQKPSILDSVSAHSRTADDQGRAHSNLIVAAFGTLGNSVEAALNRNSYGDRQSGSSGWSIFSRNYPPVLSSQPSSESMTRQPVGVAL